MRLAVGHLRLSVAVLCLAIGAVGHIREPQSRADPQEDLKYPLTTTASHSLSAEIADEELVPTRVPDRKRPDVERTQAANRTDEGTEASPRDLTAAAEAREGDATASALVPAVLFALCGTAIVVIDKTFRRR